MMAGKKKITCRDFIENVSDYIDGAMEPDLLVKLEAHLAKCPDCWVQFDETKMTVEIFQNVDNIITL